MKRSLGPLIGDSVTLRLLEARDLAMTREWRNLDRVRRWFFNCDPITPEGHLQWFERYRHRDDDFMFVIEETRELNRPVGQVALYDIRWDTGVAEYGRLMIGDEAACGRGIATRATERLIDEAFGPLRLSELILEVLPENVAARRLYRATGFVEDGTTPRGGVRMVKRK